MLRALEEQMTATEIADVCDLSQSTVYSNVERMVEEGILRKHESETAASQYSIGFDEIVIRHSNGGLDLSLTPPSRSASEQLSELWSDARWSATNIIYYPRMWSGFPHLYTRFRISEQLQLFPFMQNAKDR